MICFVFESECFNHCRHVVVGDASHLSGEYALVFRKGSVHKDVDAVGFALKLKLTHQLAAASPIADLLFSIGSDTWDNEFAAFVKCTRVCRMLAGD